MGKIGIDVDSDAVSAYCPRSLTMMMMMILVHRLNSNSAESEETGSPPSGQLLVTETQDSFPEKNGFVQRRVSRSL